MTYSILDIRKVNYDDNYKVYFTYDDIKNLPEFPEGPLVEIFNGELYMVPSPSIRHQTISLNIAVLIKNYLKDNSVGKLLTAPVDVILSMKDVFIPDLVYVSNENKYILSEKNISGTPDFIIEILSTNRTNDLVNKKNFYEKYGVREYWVIDPVEEEIIKFKLDNNKFIKSNHLDKTSKISIDTIGLELLISDIFAE